MCLAVWVAGAPLLKGKSSSQQASQESPSCLGGGACPSLPAFVRPQIAATSAHVLCCAAQGSLNHHHISSICVWTSGSHLFKKSNCYLDERLLARCMPVTPHSLYCLMHCLLEPARDVRSPLPVHVVCLDPELVQSALQCMPSVGRLAVLWIKVRYGIVDKPPAGRELHASCRTASSLLRRL